MKRPQRQESKYLLQLVFTVFVLGYWIFISYSKPPDLSIKDLSARLKPSFQTSLLRLPASSIQGRGQDLLKNAQSTPTLQIDCNNLELKHVKLSQRKIRFTGTCLETNEKPQNAELSIVNATNGYTASLFIAKNKFITDFIDLTAGQNEIQISRKNHDGTTIVQSVQLDSDFE